MTQELRTDYNHLLENIANELDIAPSKYQQAVDSYETVGGYLKDGYYDGKYPGATAEPEIYTQGSFRLGTVVRPIREGKESDYDIDLVCELQIDKQQTDPHTIKHMVGDRLKSHGTYEPMMDDEGRRCWTIQYAEDDGIGFHLDVLPGTPEESSIKQGCVNLGVSPELADQAIAITDRDEDGLYDWTPSNPNGYADWFRGRMRVAYLLAEAEQRQQLYEANQHLYASVAAVPDQLIKTPLQRSIQILKRHRDECFAGHQWEKEKPISMIITTLSAHLYEQEQDVLSALENIIAGLVHHAGLLTPGFRLEERYASKRLITRLDDGKWFIPNPVNPGENFADKWHKDNHRRAQAFFQWVVWAQQNLVEIMNQYGDIRGLGEKLEESFGSDLIGRAAKEVFIMGAPTIITPSHDDTPQVQISDPSKPWADVEK
ncbi:MAG: nucleotidyltransferase [Chloroflexota bacterium]